jgi:ABC-type branched-subunit amino acid transport system ATPase component
MTMLNRSAPDAPPTLALTATEIGVLDRLVNDKPKARQKTLSHYLIKIAGSAVISKQRGFTIVLVEQNFHFARDLADRHYVVEHGRVVAEVAARDVAEQEDKVSKFLGV